VKAPYNIAFAAFGAPEFNEFPRNFLIARIACFQTTINSIKIKKTKNQSLSKKKGIINSIKQDF